MEGTLFMEWGVFKVREAQLFIEWGAREAPLFMRWGGRDEGRSIIHGMGVR